MHRLRIALALALHALCSHAADIAPVVSWSVETNALQPSQRGRKDLELVRGETVVLECQLLSGGAALNLAEATSVLLRYTAANPATNSTHYVVTGAVHSAATGKVRVRWTAAACPADDRLQYEIAVGSPTSTVARAWGLLRLLPGVGDDSTGSAVERSTIDWSTVDSQNEGDGPWPVELADLDDVDISGRAAGEVLSWDGTNYVHVAQGGHDPVTRGAGDIGSLVGQVRAVTTNQVRAATSGIGYTPQFFSIKLYDAGDAAITTLWMDGGELLIDPDGPEDWKVWAENTDGADSGLDGDLLDGQHGAYYLAVTNHTGTIPAARLPQFSGGDVTSSGAGSAALTIGNSTVTSAKIVDGTIVGADLADAVRTVTVPVGAWKGPRDTEIPGWAYKSYATTNTATRLCAGIVNYFATQYTATIDAEFTVPAEATAWKTTGAIVLKFLGDSTNSAQVKYRAYVYRDGTSAAVYDSTANQTLASTTGITTLSIPASSLGTISPGTTYTIRLEPSVIYSGSALGFYIHSVTVQVIK